MPIVGLAANGEREATPEITGQIVDVQCSWHNTVVVTRLEESQDGEEGGQPLQVYITGDNKYGQLALGDYEAPNEQKLQYRCSFSSITHYFSAADPILQLHCMAESFLIVTERQKHLYTWGWNEHGNLALGDKTDRHAPTQVPFDGQ